MLLPWSLHRRDSCDFCNLYKGLCIRNMKADTHKSELNQ